MRDWAAEKGPEAPVLPRQSPGSNLDSSMQTWSFRAALSSPNVVSLHSAFPCEEESQPRLRRVVFLSPKV